MNIERFTHKAQEALQKTAQAARAEGHPEATPEHLTQALLLQDEGVVPALLERVGVAPGLAREDVEKELAKLPKVQGEGAEPRFSPALVKLIDLAEKIAGEFKDDYIASEHLFLALLRDGRSKAAQARQRGGPCPPHRRRRRARDAQEQVRRLARSRLYGRRREVPRRV